MFLKALEIQGFKSFPDRIRMNYNKGITAVVGPNGSGKSNISDALRWVLGETSVKQLRGGGKMENVIFGGTPKRNAMGFTSVQLILDNSDRRLDVDSDEVVIGRKYYRSGDSEYSINGQSVRLKDVYELLLDTGLGRDGYSIIGQGRIAEIVGAKSAERREIFEEASGIARYRYRKNEAERRLASTEDNLVRLRDILAELEARVGPLEKESKKAARFLQLSQERKSMEVTLWVDTIRSTREELRNHQRKIEIAEADYSAKGREMDEIFASTQGVRAEIEQLIIEIDNANNRILSLQEEISGRDAKVAVLQNDIKHNNDTIASLQEEIDNAGQAEGEISGEIASHKDSIIEIEEKLALVHSQIVGLEKQLEEMQRQSLSSGERRGQLEARLTELTKSVTEYKVGEAGAKSSAESAAARLCDERAEAVRRKQEVENLVAQKFDTEAFFWQTEAALGKFQNISSGLKIKLDSRQKNLAEAEETERKIAAAAEAAKQRANMLKDLENSLDGYQASVKSVVKAARSGQLRGIIGPVSSILSVKQGYEVAIETALGYSLQNIVVSDESAAKAAMTYLKQTNGGRATFLPLDTVKPQYLDAKTLPDGAVSAQELINYDQRYSNIVSSLLARIVVVEEINTASRVAKALAYRNRVVTSDGQVINAGGSFTGGSVSRSAGLFSRRQEITDLDAKIEASRFQRQQAVAATVAVRAEVDALSAELTAVSSESITAGGDKIRCETELARIDQLLQQNQTALQTLLSECEKLENNIQKFEEECVAAQTEQASLEAEVENLSAELSAISGDDDSFLTGREKISQLLSENRMAALQRKHDIDSRHQMIETLLSRTGEGAARKELLALNTEKLKTQNNENQQEIQDVLGDTQGVRTEIETINKHINSLRALRLEKEATITVQTSGERAITSLREELGREIARLGEQKITLEEKYDGTISKLWEEYELTHQDAETLCVDFSSVTDLRRKVAELRAKIRALGNVNVGAIEEFREVNERYTFLKQQVNDVEKSKAELERMIAELSAEMTAIFSESFAEINRHFGRIFAELFGGGQGSLELSDPESLLESGIEIKVAPPGKIIKDLAALSGGEQALVAICIYFAILAVNPAPFCVLDEIEAALDDTNVVRYAQYLRKITKHTQFIVITHRRGTMEAADVLYGVTMQEDGISKLLKLDVADVDATLVS